MKAQSPDHSKKERALADARATLENWASIQPEKPWQRHQWYTPLPLVLTHIKFSKPVRLAQVILTHRIVSLHDASMAPIYELELRLGFFIGEPLLIQLHEPTDADVTLVWDNDALAQFIAGERHH